MGKKLWDENDKIDWDKVDAAPRGTPKTKRVEPPPKPRCGCGDEAMFELGPERYCVRCAPSNALTIWSSLLRTG